jgi:hypothetical protein
MANDVTIVVEASLGDTLLKLELAKVAVNDLEDAGGSAGVALGDDSNRNSFSSRLRNLRNELGNMGDRGPLGSVIRAFGNLGAAMLAPIQFGADMSKTFSGLGSVAAPLIGVVSSVGAALVLLAAAIGAVTFAATVLATVLGTLTAVVADMIAPVTLLLGLLGGLAAGFVIGGKRAAEGGGKLNEFSKIVDTLGSMFQKTSSILAHVFLPYFVELGHAAEKALNFLDRIIKLPLGQAFRALDTRGTKLLGDFVDRVAEVLSKPLRLAFRVAFDDSAFSNMVSDWWHRFTGFLFGTTTKHPIELRPGVFKIKTDTVDGVFQPFIDWFNRHHFTQQGIRIGRQILQGVMNSGMKSRLADFIGDVFKDAMKQAGSAVLHARAWPLIRELGGKAWDWIKDKVGGILNTIASWVKGKIGAAWDSIKSHISGVWDDIVAIIEKPFSINIDWPSPPSWLSALTGAFGSSGSHPQKGSTGATNPVAGKPPAGAGYRPAMAAPNVTIHIHGADLSDAPTRRRIAQKLGKDIAADWRRRADGH